MANKKMNWGNNLVTRVTVSMGKSSGRWVKKKQEDETMKTMVKKTNFATKMIGKTFVSGKKRMKI